MTRINRRRFLATTLAAPMLLRPARAATPVLCAALLGPDTPETRVWEHLRDQVERALPGRFAFTILPNAALGAEKQVAEGLRLGSIQASLCTLSTLSIWVAQAQLFDLPFLFHDSAHLHRALGSAAGADLQEKLAQQGFIAPEFISYGARHLIAPTPLPEPAMMKGRHMRIIPSPLHAALWEAFGTLPTALPITETYNALATGVVTAMDLTTAAYAGFRLHEVAPHVTETGHIHAAGALLFAAPFWAKLNPEEQAVFTAVSAESARHFQTLMTAEEQAAIALTTAAGAVFTPVTLREDWKRIARTIWPAFAGTLGGMDRIEAIEAMG